MWSVLENKNQNIYWDRPSVTGKEIQYSKPDDTLPDK
jgi:hypothetical protein